MYKGRIWAGMVPVGKNVQGQNLGRHGSCMEKCAKAEFGQAWFLWEVKAGKGRSLIGMVPVRSKRAGQEEVANSQAIQYT